MVWSRDLASEPTSVRVFQDNLGHWYASFVVRHEAVVQPCVEGRIGIDWGVSTTATTTDPAQDLPYQGFRKRCSAEVAKAQRKMARRRRAKGQAASEGYLTAKQESARAQKKAARQNMHAARMWAPQVVRDHQLIAVEDFKPAFLGKSKNMARKAADTAIGAAKRELIGGAKRAGRDVVLVPPLYTTMTCSECFSLGLGEGLFCCEFWGHREDRDRNAARVILATGELIRASADGVSHFPSPFEGAAQVLPELEIPRLCRGTVNPRQQPMRVSETPAPWRSPLGGRPCPP
ncbi:MAG: hypothetical protein NVS1B16_14130 [Pseudarthrobacter sp.]